MNRTTSVVRLADHLLYRQENSLLITRIEVSKLIRYLAYRVEAGADSRYWKAREILRVESESKRIDVRGVVSVISIRLKKRTPN